jgi:nuclear transport factor 2 (NTF2) superfamily protein
MHARCRNLLRIQWLLINSCCSFFFCFSTLKTLCRFAYEWCNESGEWHRSYGNENWEFDDKGLMRVRLASINDLAIAETDRLYHWPEGKRRPDDHPGLSELGL